MLPLKAISVSFIGDLFVALYPQAFCIWTKRLKKSFGNSLCCYNDAMPSLCAKRSLRFTELTLNANAELSTDGRLLLVLSENSHFVHIYYNGLCEAANETAKFSVSALRHNCKVLACRFKEQNFFETLAKRVPNLLLTITADHKVHLWIETFTLPAVSFTRFEIISIFHTFPHFAFVRQNYKTQIFPYKSIGETKLLKQSNNCLLGLTNGFHKVCKVNRSSDSNDWLYFTTVLRHNT